MRDGIVFLDLYGSSLRSTCSTHDLLMRPQLRQSCAMLFPQSTATPRAQAARIDQAEKSQGLKTAQATDFTKTKSAPCSFWHATIEGGDWCRIDY